MGDTYVQVAPAGGGQNIRNLQVTVMQLDGTTATVEMQVVSIADSKGQMLSFASMETGLEAIHNDLLEILEHLRIHNS